MNITTLLLVVALIGYMMFRRYLGEPLRGQRLWLPPSLLVIWGGAALGPTLNATGTAHLTLDLAVLAVTALLAVLGGVVRGLTVRVFVRDGHLWYRYTAVTLAVWAGLIAVRVALGYAGRWIGVDAAVLAAALPVMLGLSLAGEAVMVARAALATGAPFAPRRSRVSTS